MDASGNRQRLLLAVVGVLVLAVLAGAVALWPRGRLAEPAGGGQADPTRLVPATLTSVQTVPCQEAEPGLPGSTCIKVRARPDGAEEVEFETTDPTGDTFRSGQRVRLSILEQAGQPTFYNIRDLERGRPMVARLDAGELDHLRAALARGGLAGATLTPRRSRAHRH